MAGMKAHRWSGLNVDVWLPDDIPVEVKIIGHSRFRSFQKVATGVKTKTTWHDTGNSRTNADQEWTWANNGREGAGVGGYNAIFDDRKIIICQPFDEVVWAAGTAEGNRVSWHAEHAWGGAVNFRRSLEIGAALHGGLIAAKGWSVDTALVKHQIWYGKWCPGQILNKGLWPTVITMVSDAAALARVAAATGKVVAPLTTYAKPQSVSELARYAGKDANTIPAFALAPDGTRYWYVGDRVQAVRATPRLQKAYAGAPKVGPDINAGEQFDVSWIFTADDGNEYYMSPWFTRIKVADTRRVADVIAA